MYSSRPQVWPMPFPSWDGIDPRALTRTQCVNQRMRSKPCKCKCMQAPEVPVRNPMLNSKDPCRECCGAVYGGQPRADTTRRGEGGKASVQSLPAAAQRKDDGANDAARQLPPSLMQQPPAWANG